MPMCLADALADNATIDAALAEYDQVRQRAGSWAVARSREFGACVSAEVSRNGMSAAEQAQRSERRLPRIRRAARRGARMVKRCIHIFGIFAPSMTLRHLVISVLM